MAKFSYVAIDAKGRERRGKIEATSAAEARAKLAGTGLMVSKLEAMAASTASSPEKASTATKVTSKSPKRITTIPRRTKTTTLFVRNLATLLRAQQPLLRALEVLIRQEQNTRFKQVLVSLADNVRTGNTLSDGLAQYPKIFDHLTLSMVRAGEAGGITDVVLERLATFLEKSEKLKKRIATALIYPVVVVAVATLIVGLLLVFVVPRFESIFTTVLGGAALPWLTGVVVDSSRFAASYWYILLGGLVGLWFAFKAFRSTKPGKRFLDTLALNLPGLRGLTRATSTSRFTRTFGTLLQSGVPILDALRITREIVGNTLIAEAIDTVHDRVRDGDNVAGPMERTKRFPPMVTSMIEVGEETGQLGEMLNRVADNFDENVDNTVAGFTAVLEPVMIVTLAVVVGTIVIALFLPIVTIIQQLS